MSPVPIEVDVSVGASSERASFRLVLMAPVNPQEFVRLVYDAVQAALAESTTGPQPFAEAVEEATDTGSVVEQATVPVVRSRRPAPSPPKVAPFDPEAARRRAAEAV